MKELAKGCAAVIEDLVNHTQPPCMQCPLLILMSGHWTGRSGNGIGQGGQGVALDREVRVWHWTGRSGRGIGQGGQGVALDREVRVWHWTGRSAGCGIGQGGHGVAGLLIKMHGKTTIGTRPSHISDVVT